MKILVLSAMQEEIDYIINQNICLEVDIINSQKVFKISGFKNDLYIANTGISKVNAAITTSLFINKYNPDLIINIGTSGAIDEKLKITDAVIADKLAFHDVDVTAFGYEVGQIPKESKYLYPTQIEKLDDYVRKIFKNVYKATVVTGDVFVTDINKKREIQSNFDNVYAVEMESAAIVKTALSLNTKVYVLRTISDMANAKGDIDFSQYLSIVCENFSKLIDFLKDYE